MAAVSLLGMTGAASFAVSAAESVLPEEMQTETIDDSGEETDIPRIPDMVVGSFDETADGMQKVPEDETETEIDWTVFAPDLDENGEFHLDEGYIEAYEENLCSDIIFYGDSRVVGMAYLTGGYHYVGKESTGTAWMEGEGLSYLESQMKAWPKADIVFCFGINDPGQIGEYIRFYTLLPEKYPERRFWFLSVNPVYDRRSAYNGYYASNHQIEQFNEKLCEAFPEQFLDSYSYLKTYGYNAPDGVHYDQETYFAVQDFCWREITRKLEEE